MTHDQASNGQPTRVPDAPSFQPGDPVRVAFDAVWLGTPSSHEKHEPGALVVRPGTDITGNVLLLDRWRVPAATVTLAVQPETAETVIARLRKSSTENAIRANRAEESVQRLIDDRNSNRMIADQVCAEIYRVRDALGVGPGGADLGLQVRDVLAERDAEVERLRAEIAAWKAHATHLESRLFDIWVLAERPARKCNGLDHDDVCTVAELADPPPLPIVLRETAPGTEADQPPAATPPLVTD